MIDPAQPRVHRTPCAPPDARYSSTPIRAAKSAWLLRIGSRSVTRFGQTKPPPALRIGRAVEPERALSGIALARFGASPRASCAAKAIAGRKFAPMERQSPMMTTVWAALQRVAEGVLVDHASAVVAPVRTHCAATSREALLKLGRQPGPAGVLRVDPRPRVIAPVSLPPRGSWCNLQLAGRRARPVLRRARRRPCTRGRARLCTVAAA